MVVVQTIVTLEEASVLSGRSPTTIKGWITRSGESFVIEKAGPGRPWQIDFPAMLRWREEQLIAVEGATAKLDYEEARRRKVTAEAMMAEQKVALQEGELIPKTDVVVMIQGMFGHCRARMLAIPTKLAPVVSLCETVPEIKEKLIEAINDALEELSETRAVGTKTDPKKRRRR
jgi:hypothetical protein